MRALSIRQPWAWLIVNGHKDIENRDWPTSFRGDVLVHAGLTLSRSHYEFVALDMAANFHILLPEYELLERGGIVGLATISDCVRESESPWFQGEFGFVISKAMPNPNAPVRLVLSSVWAQMPPGNFFVEQLNDSDALEADDVRNEGVFVLLRSK